MLAVEGSSKVANSMSLIQSVAGVLRRASSFMTDETARQLVYRTGAVDAGAKGWAARIVEMGDGRPVAQIVATIYFDELRAGAWAADIGVWSQPFAMSVIEVIDRLAAQGLIRIEPEQ
jgi:hypothetical protein